MKKEFSKKDLKTGHIVRFRDGGTAMLIGDEFKNCWFTLETSLGYYNDELLDAYDYPLPEGDIMEVYKMNEKMDFGEMLSIIYDNDKFLNDLIEKDYVKLIWERKEPKREIDWSKVPKWTRVLVRDFENALWEKRYFLGVDNKGYKATYFDEFTFDNEKYFYNIWSDIKLFDENDMKEEWYK